MPENQLDGGGSGGPCTSTNRAPRRPLPPDPGTRIPTGPESPSRLRDLRAQQVPAFVRNLVPATVLCSRGLLGLCPSTAPFLWSPQSPFHRPVPFPSRPVHVHTGWGALVMGLFLSEVQSTPLPGAFRGLAKALQLFTSFGRGANRDLIFLWRPLA